MTYTGMVGNPTSMSENAREATNMFNDVRSFRNLMTATTTSMFPASMNGMASVRIPAFARSQTTLNCELLYSSPEPGASCSKLTTSLVNVSLKFQTLINFTNTSDVAHASDTSKRNTTSLTLSSKMAKNVDSNTPRLYSQW